MRHVLLTNPLLSLSSEILALFSSSLRLVWTSNSTETEVEAGNFLDDHLVHMAHLTQEDGKIFMKLDGYTTIVEDKDEIKPPSALTIGMAASNSSTTHLEAAALRGCLIHFFVNDVPVDLKSARPCTEAADANNNLMGFTSASAFLEVDHKGRKSDTFELYLWFRTFESHGLLLNQPLEQNGGHLHVYLEDARMKLVIVASAASKWPLVELDTFDLAYNDGKWHQLHVSLQKSIVNFSVDNEVLIRPLTSRILLEGRLVLGGNSLWPKVGGFIGKCFPDLLTIY